MCETLASVLFYRAVNGCPADPQTLPYLRRRHAILMEPSDILDRHRGFPPPIDASGLGILDPVLLTLVPNIGLELSHSPQDFQDELPGGRGGIVSPFVQPSEPPTLRIQLSHPGHTVWPKAR